MVNFDSKTFSEKIAVLRMKIFRQLSIFPSTGWVLKNVEIANFVKITILDRGQNFEFRIQFLRFPFLPKIWDLQKLGWRSSSDEDVKVSLNIVLDHSWLFAKKKKWKIFEKKIEKFQFLFYHLESHNYITGDITGLIEAIIHHTIWFSKNSGTSEIFKNRDMEKFTPGQAKNTGNFVY